MKLNGVDITVRYIEHSNVFIPEPKISNKSKFWVNLHVLKEPMTFLQALNYVESLGNDWRLPTIEELQILSQTRLSTKFERKPYWTNEQANSSTVYTVGFITGVAYAHHKENKFYVMPVKGDIRQLELVPIKVKETKLND